MVYQLNMRGLCLLLLSVIVFGCSLFKTNTSDDPVLFTIDYTSVFSEEFIYNFGKNINYSDSAITKNDINEYLDLYINFKLKVTEAVAQGLDTTESFINEFTKYKDQLTESYLKDDSIILELVQEAYQRMRYEVNVSHIIIQTQNQSNPADTLKAFKQINTIHYKLMAGEKFEKLAIKYSEDPSVKVNNGNLGFFTALQMVYPFESMAYNTPVGEFSHPFKTRYGYHILKVNDIRPARGKVQVAHIMLRLSNQMLPNDSAFVENRIYQIYDSLNNGGNWDVLCRQFSEDGNTKNTGGILQPFEVGRVVPSFAEVAFSLKYPNEISNPVLTPYGWHIIKLVEKYPLESFEDLKDDLTERIKRDSRSELTHTYFIAKLKKENNFQINVAIKEKCLDMADSSLMMGKWDYDSTNLFFDEYLFMIQNQEYKVKQFHRYVAENQNKNNFSVPRLYINELLSNYIEQELIEYEKAHLEEKYYDYKMLVKEYREGILLFDLMNQEVWNKALIDTLGLEQYYQNHIHEYQWEERLDVMIFSSNKLQEIEMVRNMFDQSFYPITDNISLSSTKTEGLDSVMFNKLDSIIQVVGMDSTKYLEIACNEIMTDEFLHYFKSRNTDLNKIIVKEHETNSINVKILSSSKKSLEKVFNQNSALTLHVESGLYEKGDNEILDLIEWKPGIYDLSIENIEYLVYVERLVASSNKKFEEIKGQVISDYQNFLEREWIEELKRKYDVNVNKDALSKIYGHFEVI
jgi:peptidyl-prolyl cis-trans isomerase SurA